MLIETLLLSLLSAQPAAPAAPAQKPAVAAESKPAEAKPAETVKGSVAPDVKVLVERMQSFYEKTTDFRSDFKQDYKYKTFRRTQTSTGTVIYKKPGLMRWEYEKPSKRTFVLAANKVYAHDPEAQSLTVASVDTSKLSASVTFLFGQGKLADEFNIKKGTCADCKGTLLVLDPAQPDPRFRQVRLEVDTNTAQVLKSTVVDPDGSENTIAFLNLKTNVGIQADSFKINPPEGTRVDDFTKQKK
jgi:outer membrane lipoprotein carrier protein